MVAVYATFLKGLSKGMLFIALCYEFNKGVMLLAFGVARVEDKSKLLWFLRNFTMSIESLRAVVSDGAKRLEANRVLLILGGRGIPHIRCAWHISEKNLRDAKIRASHDEKWP